MFEEARLADADGPRFVVRSGYIQVLFNVMSGMVMNHGAEVCESDVVIRVVPATRPRNGGWRLWWTTSTCWDTRALIGTAALW